MSIGRKEMAQERAQSRSPAAIARPARMSMVALATLLALSGIATESRAALENAVGPCSRR